MTDELLNRARQALLADLLQASAGYTYEEQAATGVQDGESARAEVRRRFRDDPHQRSEILAAIIEVIETSTTSAVVYGNASNLRLLQPSIAESAELRARLIAHAKRMLRSTREAWLVHVYVGVL